MSRGVEEGNGLTLPVDLVSTDVLCDSTGLTSNHIGVTNPVQQRSLAVVDVTHDRDNGRAQHCVVLFVIFVIVEELGEQCRFLFFAWINESYFGANFSGVQLDHVVGQTLRSGDHFPLQEEEANDVGSRSVDLGTEVLGR